VGLISCQNSCGTQAQLTGGQAAADSALPMCIDASDFACTEEIVETVNDLVLSQEDKPQTHRTVREISRETGIHQSSLSRIICKDMHLKFFKRCRAQELTDANCVARMKRAKLLLQKFR